jgi:hypothetical protein
MGLSLICEKETIILAFLLLKDVVYHLLCIKLGDRSTPMLLCCSCREILHPKYCTRLYPQSEARVEQSKFRAGYSLSSVAVTAWNVLEERL